jgi:putative mRNA 3-end processing factor
MSTKPKMPQVDNKLIAAAFTKAASDLANVAHGKTISEGKGLFGEPRELLVFELARASGIKQDLLSVGAKAHERLLTIFRDNLPETERFGIQESSTLCLYGLVLNNYDEEDFRYLYRYLLYNWKDQEQCEKWAQKALVFLGLVKNLSGRELLRNIVEWMRFLGTPTWNPTVFTSACNEFGVDISPIMSEEGMRLIDNIRRRPQYLEEAMTGKSYHEVRVASRDWVPDGVSSKMLAIYRKRAYEGAQKGIGENESIQRSFESARTAFVQSKFLSDDGTPLPVRLQELPSPPMAEAIDPAVFELIPQKLRVDLLSSVAYSTRTKSIEIIFIGGPRIGRSGIIIKTDTGGVLLDFGLSVANQKVPEWVPELEMIDSVIISHAHLDHVGGLPILYEHYDGKWCSAGVTGGVSMALLEDAMSLGAGESFKKDDKHEDMMQYSSAASLTKVSKNHVRLEIGKSAEVGPGIVVTPIDACHIPGSAAYLLDIEGVKILYTGDFNTDQSILFPGSNLPVDSRVTMLDGTYWGREDFNRPKVAETITEVVNKHGPVIIPSFAVGRSQEILMTLEALGVTQRRNVIVSGLAERVTKLVGLTGHWQAMRKNKTVLDKEDILVAGGGMLGGGLARQHFREQCNNPDAAVILCGYLAPRTPGWNLLKGYEPHQCKVEYARLSAHSSASNLEKYVNSCVGQRIMVHTPAETAPDGVTIPDYRTRVVIPT